MILLPVFYRHLARGANLWRSSTPLVASIAEPAEAEAPAEAVISQSVISQVADNTAKPQHILHLLGSFRLPPDPDQAGSSGVVRVALELARLQAQDGHQVTVACVGPEAWQSTWHGVTLRSFRPAPWARVNVFGRGVDLSRHMPFMLLTWQQRFDVVHGHLYYYLRGLRAGVRIAHVHGDPLHKGMGSQVTGMTKQTFALLERTVDGFIAVSQFIAGRLRSGLPDSDRIHVVYNGVNFDHFTMSDADRATKRASWREQWNIAPDAPANATVYVYVGAIVPEKGVLQLARAFATIEQERADVHLVIVGSSSLWGTSKQTQDPNALYEQDVRDALAGAQARGHAHFTGKVPAPQVAELLAASDVFVMPSVWQEPCPLVILEAVASGLPLIASHNGGIPEIAACGHHHLIPAEEDALRDALRSAAQGDLVYEPPQGLPTAPLSGEDPDARLKILQTALSWERASAEVLEVYAAIRTKKNPAVSNTTP